MSDQIKTKKYTSGDEFLKDISYGGEMYQNLKDFFIFRGHQSGSYKLIPSVLRHKLTMKDAAGNTVEDDKDAPFDLANSEFFQKNIEYIELRKFFNVCDKNSLRLPPVDKIRQALYSQQDIIQSFLNEGEWLPYDLQELAALAQHYGMETRLLDWTTNIETAIYFAVHKEPDLTKEDLSSDDSNYVAIWALNQTAFSIMDTPLKIIRPPYHGNPNLAAQRGLFTFWKVSGLHISFGGGTNGKEMEVFKRLTNRTPLDELIAGECEKHGRKDVIMWKLLIPRKDRKVLYEYIRNKGVSAASLFPGYEGAVRSIKEDNSFNL